MHTDGTVSITSTAEAGGNNNVICNDTFVSNTTANGTFIQFLCYHLLTNQDRAHKVYISWKLGEFISPVRQIEKPYKNVSFIGPILSSY